VRTVTLWRLYHWIPYSLWVSSRAATSGAMSPEISSKEWGRYMSLAMRRLIIWMSHTGLPVAVGTPAARRRSCIARSPNPSTAMRKIFSTTRISGS
jgi:hypothetical protein